MRAITVDLKGFIFSTKLFLVVGVVASAWLVWGPVQQYLSFTKAQSATNQVQAVFSNEQGDEATISAQSNNRPYVVIAIDEMRLDLFTTTDKVEHFTIVKVPKQGSLETIPEGTYTVDEKVATELSTVTMTRFPYFVSFGDSYAVHGTPTDAEGKESIEKYVGGMVELKTEDAERLYNFVEMGTLVQVETEAVVSDAYMVRAETPVQYDGLPATSAKAYALGDVSNGQIFLDKNESDVYPIASITKLITALVATNVIGHESTVEAPNGEYYTLSDLYYPLLLQSDNAVAQKLASHAGVGFFMSNMNAYVQTLGMKHTSFKDSSGLSPKNISTASDLVKLAQYLYTENNFLLDITAEERMTITSARGVSWNIKNQNKLASDPHFRGGKLGYTDEAGQTSVAIFNVPIHGEVRPIVVVILNSKDWKQDTRTLLKWLVDNT